MTVDDLLLALVAAGLSIIICILLHELGLLIVRI